MIRSKKIIAIGDIHTHYETAEKIASLFDPEEYNIIFTGDYFDFWNDSPKIATKTAEWLKNSLEKPNRIHLLGNHDLSYSPFGRIMGKHGKIIWPYICSGYSEEKEEAIDKVLSPQDWIKIKTFHFSKESGHIFTHAGIHPYWVEHPIKGMDINHILELLQKNEDVYFSKNYSLLLGAVGKARGGEHIVGGIIWRDNDVETKVSPNIKQVFGHTPLKDPIYGIEIQTIPNYNSTTEHINIDCGLKEVLKLEREVTSIIKTEEKSFYSI